MTSAQFAAASFNAAVVGGAAGGFTSGLVANNGHLKSGVQGGLTGGLSAGLFYAAGSVGEVYGAEAHYAGHAVAGCVSSAASGGDCANGAIAQVASLGIQQATDWATKNEAVAGFTSATLGGGFASQLMGGSFADGAKNGAYGYLFNQLNHREPILDPTPPPEVQDALAVLQPLANRAAENVDANCNWLCSVTVRGTLIHSEFERLVKASPYAGFTTEQTYLDGVPMPRGTPGPSRADVVYGAIVKPIVAFDLKTGFWSTLSYDQAVKYGKNLPKGTYLAVIKPK